MTAAGTFLCMKWVDGENSYRCTNPRNHDGPCGLRGQPAIRATTVFAVMAGDNHEGAYLSGVYSTLERAEQRAAEIRGSDRHYDWVRVDPVELDSDGG